MKQSNYITTFTRPARKPRCFANLTNQRRFLYGRTRHYHTGKERDSETGLYYYGARYLDPKASRWLSGDPAVSEYIPSAPINDEARKQNQNLPGMGGVYNTVNMHAYHYAGNNPVKYVDPDGKKLEISFYVKAVVKNSAGGTTATGYMTVYNTNTKDSFIINNVKSGGLIGGDNESSDKHAPFGTYDILGSTKKDRVFMRLEANDNHYGDDKVNFPNQEEHSEIRLHDIGSGTTYGCISVPEDGIKKIGIELKNTSTSLTSVETKYVERKYIGSFAKKLKPYEIEKKYGELKVIDITKGLQRPVIQKREE